jgi:cellulose synthase/poly-beta-1,6-N-acetylglucosamine synthase-like glycosyltransferase
MLRECIFGIKNQTYKNLTHSVNIVYDDKNDVKDILKIFDDIDSNNLQINCNKNSHHQHWNYIKSLSQNIDINDYDLFIKIDDDDIYKKDYVNTIVKYFEKNEVDIVSSKISLQLNGEYIRNGIFTNLGGCDHLIHKFNMPMTFAFNHKGYEQIINLSEIYGFEDHMWRDVWDKNCKVDTIQNDKNIIWHIHGKNISTSDFLTK